MAYLPSGRTDTLIALAWFTAAVITIRTNITWLCVSGFPAAAYAAYAAGRGYSGYPSFGLPYPTGNALASLHHHPLPLLPYHPLEHLGVYGGGASLHAMPLWTNARRSRFQTHSWNGVDVKVAENVVSN